MAIHSHPPNANLMGMFHWCQDHADELTEDEAMALQSALMLAGEVGPDGSPALTVYEDDDFEQHADVWAVVLRIAESHQLVPLDELPE
jgi:hypothetical protein